MRFAFGALALGIVAIGAVALWALDERDDAEQQRNIAVSRELALQSADALEVDPELALRLALWADDTAPTEQAGAALREATLAFRPSTVLRADPLDANTAAYSPDGERVVTGGTTGRAVVWDAATRREVARLAAGHGAVHAARYAPSGDRIALGFADGTLAVTDPSLAQPKNLLRVRGQDIHDLAFSRDGQYIAAVVDDGTVRLMPLEGGGRTQRLTGHQGPVRGVDVSPDGSRVVSAGDDGSVRLWSNADDWTGKIIHSGRAPQTDVVFSPDGQLILGVGSDRRARLWDAQTGAEQVNLSGELQTAAFSTDGRRFAVGGKDGVIRVWSVEGGPPVAVLSGQGARVYDVGFGPSSDRVVSAADDGSVRIWDAGRTQAWSIPSLTYDIEFNRDGRLIASGSDDGTMRVWDPASGRLRASLPGPQGVTFGKFSPKSDTLVLSASAPQVRLWPVSDKSAEVVARLPKGRSVVFARFDPTGTRIVYTDDSGRVAIRDLRSGREVTLGGTPKIVYGAEWSPDGQQIFVVPDRDVLVWDIDRPARPEFALKGHDGSVHSMDFSRDGRVLTGGADRTARIWNRRGKQQVVMRGHEDELTSALFIADGTQVLSASQDGSVRLFDARTGVQLAVIQSAEGELYDLALSREGKIATLGKGEVVRVFACEVCGSLDRVRALARSRSPRPLTAEEREQFLAAAE